MKQTLLILITFISINCFGQFESNSFNTHEAIQYTASNEEQLKGFDWSYGDISNNNVIYKSYHTDRIIMLNILNQYSEYETECYNDSTEQLMYMIEYFNGVEMDTVYSETIKWMPECYITQAETKYTHKQPTFPDFMEWLKTKYK